MPQQRRAQLTRRAILIAAAEEFDRVGYDATSLNAILRRGGITKGAFYFHFSSKEDVAEALTPARRVDLGGEHVDERLGRPADGPVGEDADGLPVALEHEALVRFVVVDGEVVSRPPYAATYWSPAQMLAQLTANGASLRTGDLYASGTISGDAPDQLGSLLELHRGERFLHDGAEVTLRACAPGALGGRITLGEVTARILPALTD